MQNKDDIQKFSGLYMPDGRSVYTQEYIQHLRDEDMKHPGTVRAYIAQKGAQENMLAANVDILICGGSRGGPLEVNTRVVTPFGYRRIGDLKAGDIISGTDGGMQRVVYRKDHGKLPSYRIKFVDGSEVIASYDHLWNVRKTCYASKKRRLYNLSINDDYRVWTTQDIVEHLTRQKDEGINSRILIPLCEPVKFTKVMGNKYVPKSPPYVIGAILGDGCVTDNIKAGSYDAVLCSADKDVVSEFEKCGISMNNLAHKEGTAACDCRIENEALQSDLKGLGLYGCNSYSKFVPEFYKFASIDARWSILQGLMDTDGSVDSRGHCTFSSTSEQLARDVKFLVNSLGGLATISKHKSHYVNDGSYVEAHDYYSVYIRIKDSERLFRLPRKKSLCTAYNGGISELGRRIVSFEYVGEQECCCIAVNNANSLFMVEDFIVTHNSKSFSLLMEVLKDITNPNFTAILLRKESKDLDSLINDSYKLYSDFGLYNRSINDMTWNFNNGGWLKFSYYDGLFQKFKDRFQGRQYAFVGIDEITQCEYKKFKYLTTVNRNASHIRSRFWGTCNPDPDSWVRKFIDWWIDEDGYAIQERCGKTRYCYMDGDSPDSIYWGDTREDVYSLCPRVIDSMWNDKLEEVYTRMGMTKLDVLIKSVTFVRADLSENIKLISSDPSYLGNLAQQDEEQRMRDLQANWNWKATGDDMIKYEDMEGFFHNAVQEGDRVRRASADIAFTGGDNFVMWLWVGDHISDLVVMRLDPKTVVSVVEAKLREWGVEESNLTYDMQGMGQYFKGFFPEAMPFNNQAAPIPTTREEKEGIKYLYKDLKSQCAFLLYKEIKEKTISIDKSLLDRKFSGDGYKNWTLDRILQKERKAIRRDESGDDRGFHVLPKKTAKKFVGHSPDFIESLYYIFYLTRLSKKKHTKANGLWMF